MESGMTTITGFVFVMVAAACAACATHGPATSSTARTLPALPQPQIYSASQLAALRRTPGGNYPGYQRIRVDGQAHYCRKNRATGSDTESTVVCITEAQIWAEQLRVQELASAQERAQELASAQEQDLRRSGTQQIENQEASRQQLQSIAVNNPVTVVPMPVTHP
jgi:hypothetical protein